MRIVAISMAALLIGSAAHAATDPAAIKGSDDTRIRTVDYSDHTLTNMTSTALTPITIIFGAGQVPKLVSGLHVIPINITPEMKPDDQAKMRGECQQIANDKSHPPGWCATWNANELTLQPLNPDTGSMLTVRTQSDTGKWYNYMFHLSTREGFIGGAVPCPDPLPNDQGKLCYDKDAYFNVTYTYKAEEAVEKAKVASASGSVEAQRAKKVRDRLLTDNATAPREYHNWAFQGKDCASLAPQTIADDGRQTYLHFAMNTPLSLASYPNPAGSPSERDAAHSSDVAPDSGTNWTFFIVPREIILRRDKQVCAAINTKFNVNASTPFTGTSSPFVVRQTR